MRRGKRSQRIGLPPTRPELVGEFHSGNPDATASWRIETSSTKDTLMYTEIDDAPVVNEEVWRAWVQKGKLREEATARRARVLGGIVLVLLAFGSAFYLLAVR